MVQVLFENLQPSQLLGGIMSGVMLTMFKVPGIEESGESTVGLEVFRRVSQMIGEDEGGATKEEEERKQGMKESHGGQDARVWLHS